MMFDILNELFASEYTSSPDLRHVLAANLRRARVARRLSLSELARATSLGKATLSDIENARANPTVETLRLLADALQVRVGELLDEPKLDVSRVVRRPRAPEHDGPSRRPIDRLTPDGPVDVVELWLPARHEQELPAGPPGSREELYVVQGTLIAGPIERPTELAAGDWAVFPADVVRQLSARRGNVRALLLTHA